MLEPANRTLFFEMLRPPEGMRLDEAIATTFTLDLVTLLTAPLAFTMFDWSDRDGRPTADPLLLLEGLRRNADRLSVFCQAGRVAAPATHGNLFSYLESMVIEVMAPKGGVFHPKMWLLRFVGEDEPARYRLVCLSRNLTGDRSWDLTLVMDGELIDRQKGFSRNRPLGEFVAALPGLSAVPVSRQVADRCRRMAEEVRRVDFEPPEPFRDYTVWPLGVATRRAWPFPDRAKRTLAMSPFLSGQFLKCFAGASDENTLISRLDELAKLPPSTLEGFENTFILSDSVETSTDEDTDAPNQDTTLSGLHAKLFVIDHGNGKDTSVFVGSANATSAAFAKNVELLIELDGPSKDVGVERFLEGGPGEASLMSLLQSYTPPDAAEKIDPVLEELEKQLDEFRLELTTAGLRAAVAPAAQEGYIVTLTTTRKLHLSSELGVTVWPISVPEAPNAKPLEHGGLSFGPLPLAAVTSFFAVCAVASRGEHRCEARFVLNIPLKGDLPGRREAVLGTLLDDPEKFLRFLQFLLGDLDDLGPTPSDQNQESGAWAGAWTAGSFALLEAMVRALRTDPKRLDHIESAVQELASLPGGVSRLPPGFMDIWSPLLAARRRLSL